MLYGWGRKPAHHKAPRKAVCALKAAGGTEGIKLEWESESLSQTHLAHLLMNPVSGRKILWAPFNSSEEEGRALEYDLQLHTKKYRLLGLWAVCKTTACHKCTTVQQLKEAALLFLYILHKVVSLLLILPHI